jgi:hypothetical protein
MTVKDTSGAAVAKASVTATPVVDGRVTIGQDLFDVVTVGGRTRTFVLARAGARVHPREIDRWYPAASITAVTPSVGLTAGGTAITVTGQNLSGVTAVTVGGIAATALLIRNDHTLTCVTPAHTAGAANVVASTQTGPATAVGAFTFVDAPQVTRVVPYAAPTGGGQHLTITGVGLLTATGVSIGGAAATQVQPSADGLSLTCLSPVRAATATGDPADVVVTTAGGTGTLANAMFFYDAETAPHITSVDPVTGPGGTEITATGRNFTAHGGVSLLTAQPLGYIPNTSPGRGIGATVIVNSATALTATLDQAANIAARDDPYLDTSYVIVPATDDFEGTSEATFTLTAT